MLLCDTLKANMCIAAAAFLGQSLCHKNVSQVLQDSAWVLKKRTAPLK